MTHPTIEKIVVLLRIKVNSIIMTNNLSVLLKKYSVPALFLIVGILLLIVGVKTNQDWTFMMSAVLMFVAGALSALYSSGKLKTSIILIFGAMAGIAGIYALYMSTTTVKDTIATQDQNKYAFTLSTQNLMDIRYVQKEHFKKNGTYLKTWDEFTDFLNNGTIPFVESEGTVPGRRISSAERDFLYGDNRAVDNKMTEEEAVLLSRWAENPDSENAASFNGFRRDTVPMDLFKSKFGTAAYKSSREKLGLGKFYSDSLRFIPFSSGQTEWLLEVQDSVEIGAEFKITTVKVSGMRPFMKDKDDMMGFGSKNSGDLTGTWENE